MEKIKENVLFRVGVVVLSVAMISLGIIQGFMKVVEAGTFPN